MLFLVIVTHTMLNGTSNLIKTYLVKYNRVVGSMIEYEMRRCYATVNDTTLHQKPNYEEGTNYHMPPYGFQH